MDLNRILAPIRRRIDNMVARAVLRLVTDTTGMQGVQLEIMKGEVRDGEHFQEFGFSSVALAGAEVVVVFPGGNRDHPLVLAVADRRYRPTGMEPGESAHYNHLGDYVKILNGRIVEVKAGTKVLVDAPLAEFTGNVTIAGTLDVTGNVTGHANITAGAEVRDQNGAKSMSGMRTVYNGHVHSDPGGGNTGTPNAGM